MTFTDEDLKRLKECIDPRSNTLYIGLIPHFPVRSVILNKKHPDTIDAQMLVAAYEAWRKAAGK